MKLLQGTSSQSMTSLEIASLVEKRHDNVKRTIETLAERGVISFPQIEEKATAGRPSTFYVFKGEQGKRDSIVVVAQLSPEFTARLVDRWQELERKEQERQLINASRSEARLEFKPMTNAIAEAHDDIKPYHFSNEADLINRIALGMTASKFRKHHDIEKNEQIRDYLTKCQLDCIIALQRANTVYIEDGLDFQERKVKLADLFNRKHKDKLIAEIHLLEA